jgi:small subunit ribosomal protein S8
MDPISNLINGLKNASKRNLKAVSFPYSNLKMEIAELLKKEGYISDVDKNGKKVKKTIDITLKYDDNGNPVIAETKRVSKFSRRVYKGVKEINPIKNGYGLVVLSTPKGVMSGKQAKKENVGGEVLFEIW